MKFTPGGIPVANFSLAVKETYKNGDGEKKTNTLWIRCVAWWRWAEIAGEFVGKGKFLYVTTLRFLGPPKNGTGPKAAESSKPAEPVEESDNPLNEAASVTADQDIPF
jgi:hypothetical protein